MIGRIKLAPTAACIKRRQSRAGLSRACYEELSDYARATFERSLHVALARGDRHLGADHLLLAALADAQGGAARTLAELGVDPAAIRGRIAP